MSNFTIKAPLRATLLLGLAASLPMAAHANFCDPDDTKAVAKIDAKVDQQLTDMNKLTTSTDGIVDAAELAARESGSLLGLNQAQLRLDIEQLLVQTCAPKCAKAPAPPSSFNSAQRCWTCTNPRLMLRNSNGGYLEDVVDLVGDDVDAADKAGLPVDIARARLLLGHATSALAAGDVESSFTFSCQAYGTLACGGGGKNHAFADPEPVAPDPAPADRPRSPAGFAGAPVRNR